ncbi:cytidylyltransferase domain-containing protein [Curtobacterium sp. MCBA15_004]|uniref:acylneuraminate cytidylyltransferase family protein n=1 Tax=unclassified Curtobacterium TaxID=257496 RepID=UPI0008DD2C6E|nr:acylneuraminate cytidylyltransferase family protein [Curtobacterium sp. MCBA15_004]WIA97810.1 NTP transferase domain-containing protein [Curtobacterium sp. MCBA15_004]
MRSPGTVVAVVPARAGSKGLPGKNLRTVGGRSLVRRTVESLLRAETVDLVVVSTDGDAIAAEAEAAGARVVRRPPELSGDEASSESAVLHVLDLLADGARREENTGTGAPVTRATPPPSSIPPAVVLLVQATSPFIDPADVDTAVRRVRDGHADAVFAATPSHAFLWRTAEDGTARAVNHDAAVRPRRQDREAEYRETGAFYALAHDRFRATGHRFSGRVEFVVVDPRGAVDVDDAADLELAATLAERLDRPDPRDDQHRDQLPPAEQHRDQLPPAEQPRPEQHRDPLPPAELPRPEQRPAGQPPAEQRPAPSDRPAPARWPLAPTQNGTP